ncbi:hypothetical protein TNCV_3385871 [Trichonephila clavipes]|uniref:Uncharacterized protein n=1 Tax=Trichonephila clavipes TaxID=2585209 RepID=A0A8X6T1B5_TRICX|nr:hypothetical protein TNCV_3385871 [Trichonephila clavipes]
MSKIYRSVFELPSILIRDVNAVYPIVAQTITPGTEILFRYLMQAGDERFPWSLRISIRPSEYCPQNRCPSENTTFWHSSIQFCRLEHQSSCLFLCCIVKVRRSNGHRVHRPRCCKHAHSLTNGP